MIETNKFKYEIKRTISKSHNTVIYLTRKEKTEEYYFLKTHKEIENESNNKILENINFRKEINIVTSFDQPNIPKISDTFFDGNKGFIFYPYYEGKTLANIFSNCINLNIEDSISLILQLLNTLEYIHLKGYVFCNINPDSIFVNKDKGVILIDFGSAMTEEEAYKLTGEKIIGTIPYISLEQSGFTDLKIDSRSDLFCTAIIFYRLLCGNLPFSSENDSVERFLDQILKYEIHPIKNVPPIINAILIKALKPSPDDRYQTALGMKHDIQIAQENINSVKNSAFILGKIDDIAAVNKKKHFIAREYEISLLQKGKNKLCKGIPSSFLFYGNSGIGKSYIVNEFKLHTNERRITFISLKCNRFTRAHPYSIFRLILLEFISKVSSSTTPINMNLFKQVLNNEHLEFSGLICKTIPELKEFFIEIKDIDQVVKEKERDRIIRVFTDLLTTLSENVSLIVFIDDIQWIDQTSFEILKNILEFTPKNMFIFNFRTKSIEEDLYLYGNDLRSIKIDKIIPVQGFTRNEIHDLIIMRFGNINEIETLINILSSKTDGSPFVLAEAIRFLTQSEILKKGVNGWYFKKNELSNLPDKFDTVSLILNQLNLLKEDEKRYLTISSIVEGKFKNVLIEKLADFDHKKVKNISFRLEKLGFLVRQLYGGYSFSHDKVKDAILSYVPEEDRYFYNEKLAGIYESMIPNNKAYLFNSTECYLKSKNLEKSIEGCFKAAKYAVQRAAFDVAIHYFKLTLLMANSCLKLQVSVPVDVTKVKIAFGNVLIQTAKNQEAFNIFQRLLNESTQLSATVKLELKYKIGSIFFNNGEFEKSVPYFKDILSTFGIKFPTKRGIIIAGLLWEIIKQIGFSAGLKKLFTIKCDTNSLLKLRIFNKLSYSLFFDDMIVCLLTHFKCLNLADTTINSYEKAESYSLHMVPIYQIMHKKRSYKYFNKSVKIAQAVNRKDSYAFALQMKGLIDYYSANWTKCEESLYSSIKNFRAYGDITGQLLSEEHLWKMYHLKGLFDKSIQRMNNIFDICKKSNEKYYFPLTKSALYLINYLKTGAFNKHDLMEIEVFLAQAKPYLYHTEIGLYLCQTEILQNNISQAFLRLRYLLELIKKKSFNCEYHVRAYIMYCEVIDIELKRRRDYGNQLHYSSEYLTKEYKKYLFILKFSCFTFPAYLGSYYRCKAQYLALKNSMKAAKRYFLKAINRCHSLDMRYEEAKSIKEFGLFLEECKLPGDARDQFNKAYQIFYMCGTRLECDRLTEKIDPETRQIYNRKYSKNKKIDVNQGDLINHIRVDSLYEVSSLLSEIDDIELLFKQILNAMIKITGAQYAWLFLEPHGRVDKREISIDCQGNILKKKEMPYLRNIVAIVKEKKKIILINDVSRDHTLLDKENSNEKRFEFIRSVLCVPLCHFDNYLGCVYLGNNNVAGLFNNESKKIVKIISVQAGVLLENAYIMDEYKELNKNLQYKVKEYTKDIRGKNSQLMETNLKLVNSERMNNILTGTIVHDIKNYTAGIEGHIRILSRKFPDNRPIKRTLSLVTNSCIDIVNLTSNLLDIGKLEESKLEPKKEILSLDTLMSIINNQKNTVLFEERNISIRLIKPDSGFSIHADEYLVTRVFQNLFSNASKYAPKNGNVCIKMYSESDEDIISFFCSGIPIPEKDREIIFDKYMSSGSMRHLYSKGLGLFFCKMVASAHDGRIWLDTGSDGNYFKIAFRKTTTKVPVH